MLRKDTGQKMRSRLGGIEVPRVSVEAIQNDMTLSQSEAPESNHAPNQVVSFNSHGTQQSGEYVMYPDFLSSDIFSAEDASVAQNDEDVHFGTDTSTTTNSSLPLTSRTLSRGIGNSLPNLVVDFDSYLNQFLGIEKISSTSDISLNEPYQGFVEPFDVSSKLAPALKQCGHSRSIPSLHSSSKGAGQRGDLVASGVIQHLRLDDTKENQSLVKTALARGHNIRDVFLAGLGALGKEGRSHIPPPNPPKQTITMVQMSTVEAYLSILTAIGFTIQEMKDKTAHTKFYHPQALATGNFDEVIASSQHIPRDLRPTAAQVMCPHPAWIDLLPFPTLRDGIILRMLSDPLLANSQELEDDLFMRNGIFCWRSSEKGGSGQPWDMRSWEAEPWFLQKWQALLGGENNELWKQTQWWRAARGKENVKAKQVQVAS